MVIETGKSKLNVDFICFFEAKQKRKFVVHSYVHLSLHS
ncbi:hypothetical protein NY10_2398 [Carnobacterium antarcticum]|nr:hypothetical protein NY10_2398 [Carnobacterium sp. CP1]